MKKFVAVLLGETSALAWTLGGTALVLITLSGETQKTGLYISIGSFVVHMVGVFYNAFKESDVAKETETE